MLDAAGDGPSCSLAKSAIFHWTYFAFALRYASEIAMGVSTPFLFDALLVLPVSDVGNDELGREFEFIHRRESKSLSKSSCCSNARTSSSGLAKLCLDERQRFTMALALVPLDDLSLSGDWSLHAELHADCFVSK